MKKFMQTIQNMLLDAALLDRGVTVVSAPRKRTRAFWRSFEEHFIEIAFAEAADYDQIHKAIQREQGNNEGVTAHECRCGDNDSCFAH